MSTFLTKSYKPKSYVDADFFYTGDQAFSAIIYGKSRSGKTVQLVGKMDTFIGLGHYNFVNDCAKGYSYKDREPRSELLMWSSPDLQNIKGARLIVPPGCNIHIDNQKLAKRYKVYQAASYGDIFKIIARGGSNINVVCIDSFLLSPMAKARFWALFVIELRTRIFPDREKHSPLPLIGALDQINYIFPSSAVPIVKKIQGLASGWFATFMTDAAGSGVRMLATSHRIKGVNKSVRDAFLWKYFKTFGGDLEDVSKKANTVRGLVSKLEPSELFVIDDGNMNDFYNNVPNITYDICPVYYEGERIEDDLWMLDSRHQIRVMTPNEINMLKVNKPSIWERRVRIAIGYSTGKSYDELAAEESISRKTVENDLKKIREVAPSQIINEQYRDHIRTEQLRKLNSENQRLEDVVGPTEA